MLPQKDLQHFILTRFNLLLWRQDKGGTPVRTTKWLDHRFSLFERFCLPSVKGQTCQDFEWIVLVDSKTPEPYMQRLAAYQHDCPQMVLVYVEPKNGYLFAQIFRTEVLQRLQAKRVITSYLDNDDALNVNYVHDLQQRVTSLSDGTFIYYADGYQYYTDYQYLMQIRYRRNHFVSVVESGNPSTLKTIYGYGSHYFIHKIKGAKIEHVKALPMWCEIIHDKNVSNDAYFFNAKMVKDKTVLQRDFSLNETIHYGIGIYLFKFLPHYAKTFVKRCRYHLRRITHKKVR